jgi:hypothetical protein
MWFVNSPLSSSLMVWLTFALDPWTSTLPAFEGKTGFRTSVLSFTLSWKNRPSLSDAVQSSEKKPYLHPIFQLHFPTGIYADMLERFARAVVGFSTRL